MLCKSKPNEAIQIWSFENYCSRDWVTNESWINVQLLFDFWIGSLCGCMYLSLELYDGLLLSDTKWMMHDKGKQSHNVYILNGVDSFHTACSQLFLSLFVSLFLYFLTAKYISTSHVYLSCCSLFNLFELKYFLWVTLFVIFSCQYFFLIPPKKELPCSSVSCCADWWPFINSWMVFFLASFSSLLSY